MPLHPQARALLEELSVAPGPPLHEMSVLQARSLDAGFIDMQGPALSVAEVRDILVTGGAGALPARIYHPEPGRQLPVLVFFHGGGYVVGDIEVVDRPCRALALAARHVVVSVAYRLSPETKFPGPVEDCFAAVTWVAEHAAEIGGQADAISVAGESAGGGLAAAVGLMARDRGGPSMKHQVLLYPTLAPARGSPYQSYQLFGEGYMLTRRAMEWFWDHYLGDPSDATNPYASPLESSDLRGLPPALVVTAEFDPLRDEGETFVRRLQDAGVATDLVRFEGAIHGFLIMDARLDHGSEVVRLVAAHLASAPANDDGRTVH